jgi:hypothetical protein
MKLLLPAIAALAIALAPCKAISIAFDYSYDASGFFAAHPAAQTDLEAAATFYSQHLVDSLSVISPDGDNTWSATFFNPSRTDETSASTLDLSLSQNQILVYVAGADLGGGTLGVGGPGGYSGLSGSSAFIDAVQTRGQARTNDFGPWGGSISFDLNATWYFDPDPGTLESFSGQDDFYSTALHELGHVLGIGTADSWNARISSGNFLGPVSEATFGAPVPLNEGLGHWADGTMSTVFGTTTPQEAAMAPFLTIGTRKLVTTLDAAGLQDVGWSVVPEPPIWSLGLCALALALGGCLVARSPSAHQHVA